MLVVAHFQVPEPEADGFAPQALAALDAFAARPGYRTGRLGRAIEDPVSWVLTMEWDNLGSYRRALSAYDVKMATGPLMGLMQPGPSAFDFVTEENAAQPAAR